MKVKILYIGTSPYALQHINQIDSFILENAICEAKRISPFYTEIAKKNNINIIAFNDKQELLYILDIYVSNIELFIIYQFDYIIPKKYAITGKFFNFHAGSLKTNRGAHPIIRSILNGDITTELTLHRINEKIDQGVVVGTYGVAIDDQDDAIILKEKLEKGFLGLLQKLVLYYKKESDGVLITEGKYYKPIQEADYTINIWEDTESQIRNKIRSQKQYRGALLLIENKRFYVSEMKDWKNISKAENEIEIQSDSIEVYRTDATFILTLNTNGQ